METQEKEIKLWSNLRALVDSYFAAQKSRIGWSNRLDAIKRGADAQEDPKLLQAQFYHDQFHTIERKAFDEIESELDNYKVWPWLQKVKGIGPTLAGKLLSEIDIRKAPHVSNLWAFCGQGLRQGEGEKWECTECGYSIAPFADHDAALAHVVEFHPGVGAEPETALRLSPNWQIQRLRKGVKIDYSPRLKSTCFLIGGSFLRCGSPYRRVYDSAKDYYKANRKDWTLKHIDMASRRKMVKIFLSHLWAKYREAEGLEVTLPYPIAKLPGHTHYSAPEDFETTKGK